MARFSAGFGDSGVPHVFEPRLGSRRFYKRFNFVYRVSPRVRRMKSRKDICTRPRIAMTFSRPSLSTLHVWALRSILAQGFWGWMAHLLLPMPWRRGLRAWGGSGQRRATDGVTSLCSKRRLGLRRRVGIVLVLGAVRFVIGVLHFLYAPRRRFVCARRLLCVASLLLRRVRVQPPHRQRCS